MAQAERDAFERLDHLTGDVIHLFRRCKMTPARAGSAVQFTMFTKALLDAGWTPPAPAGAGNEPNREGSDVTE